MFVTTPKLPPPPRTPHKSSGFSSALACAQLAVGSDDVDGAHVVERQAEAPRHAAEAAAEREPATPVCDTVPADVTRPNCIVSLSMSPSRLPPET